MRDICFAAFIQVFFLPVLLAKRGLKNGYIMYEIKNSNCSLRPFSARTVNVEQMKDGIFCRCNSTEEYPIFWTDQYCNNLTNVDHFLIENSTLKLTILESSEQELQIYCSNGFNCTEMIHIKPEKEDIGGLSPGVLVFLGILISLIGVALIFCVYKKFRNKIYLCCRDTCTPSSDRDGKEYDAYISIGKNTDNLKFAERNFVDVLQRNYNYKFFIDDDNLLPQLEFSEKVQSKMHKCRRLVVVFTPSYMATDWCIYCFSEGLRKLLELKVQMVFIICDIAIQREINSLSELVGHVPKIYVPFHPITKSKKEREEIVEKVRLLLSPPRRSSVKIDARAPMLSEVEEVDDSSAPQNVPSKDMKYSTLENTSTTFIEEEQDNNKSSDEGSHSDGEDPKSIKVHQYKAKKNFYSITAMEIED